MIANQIENINKNTEIMGEGEIQIEIEEIKRTITGIKCFIDGPGTIRSWDAG